MNEKVDLWIQSTNFDKDVIEVFTMLESKSSPIKFGHGLLKGRTYTVGVGTHN